MAVEATPSSATPPSAAEKRKVDLAEARRRITPDEAYVDLCEWTTRKACSARTGNASCAKVHFVQDIRPHTDPSLGDCSYLNTCHRMETCRYLHWALEDPPPTAPPSGAKPLLSTDGVSRGLASGGGDLLPPQWLDCDLKGFDFGVLGKFDVVMMDPPWDIHMSLPYGTMTDDEMRAMPVPMLQDDGGLIFVWVTGRALDLGRECLRHWGYERIEEIVWIKINQLQRLIRTGRTGHYLNHSKEHCLVGVKRSRSLQQPPAPALSGNELSALLSKVRRGLDADVIVSEVRETSRKPDEIYEMIERCCPGGRKVELFGRPFNYRPGWLTLGNQLGSNRLYEADTAARFNQMSTHPSLPVDCVLW